jgi:cytochrome c556
MKKVRIGVILILSALLLGIATASVDLNTKKVDQRMQNIDQQIHNAGAGVNSLIRIFENFYRLFMKLSLPDSLDKFYAHSTPEVPSSEWVGEMFKMAGAFDGVVVNMQEGDMPNAIAQYNIFADEYKKVSEKVPEWKGYFDIPAVHKLGTDLKSGASPSVLGKDIGAIGATCEKCMGERMAQVQAKYYWKNFDTVNVSTAHGNASWKDAMGELDGDFAGITINAQKADWNAAELSLNHYKSLYKNLKEACKNCHDTPRLYYDSDDVFTQIDNTEANVTAQNLSAVMSNTQWLGNQCYRCHALHMPAQQMKNKMGK